jgi:hypothetical protein
VFGAAGICRDKRQIDIRLLGAGQLHLRLFCSFFQSLEGHFVIAEIDALILCEFIGQIINNAKIKVFSSKMCIAIGRLDFEDPLADLQDRYVKGSAAQIEDSNLSVSLLVQAVGKGRGRGLNPPQSFSSFEES